MKGLKVQVRQGVFETNSSSTHAISIMSYSECRKEDWFDEYTVPAHVHFGVDGQFGWEFSTYNDIASKAAYFWITCCTQYGMLSERDKLSEIMSTVTTWLNEEGVTDVTFDVGEYTGIPWRHNEDDEDDGDRYSVFDGYVDHSDFEFVELLLSNKKIFLSYLLNHESQIATGNDNDDAEVEYADGAKWTFWKGN